MTFRVGQKLECVNADGANGPCLKKGAIYICTGAPDDPEFVCVDCCSVHREEFPDAAWYRWRFRPVTETKTDISIFKKMLLPKRQRVTAD